MTKNNAKPRGRPEIPVKKKPLNIMLDPRYIEHIKKIAADEGVELQEFLRRAMYSFAPNPFKPNAATSHVLHVKPPKR